MTQRLLATAVGLALAGCTSLGGTVRGDFTCRAAQGTCAPMSVNDAGALAAMTQDRRVSPGREHAAASGATRTGERLLSVVLPAHVDADGVLHDAATVHVVVEPAHWQPIAGASDRHPATLSARSLPPSLREVITGAPAPVMEGLEHLPSRAPQPFPSAAALDAARAGHRIRPSKLPDLLADPAPSANSRDPKAVGSAPTAIRPMSAAPLVVPTNGEPK